MQVVEFPLTVVYGDAGYGWDIGSDMKVDQYNAAFVVIYTAIKSNSWMKVNDTGKNILFPNSTAHPVKADITFGAGRTGSGSCSYIFSVNGVELFTESLNTDGTHNLLNLTYSEILNSTKSTEIKAVLTHGLFTGVGIGNYTVKYYFNRYDFIARMGTGIASVEISSSTGYDGDSITYTCVDLILHYEFDGWYHGDTKISSSLIYVHTVDGSDLALEARAIRKFKLSVWYRGAYLIDEQKEGDVSITYDNKTWTISPSYRKTMLCAGTICSSDIIIGDKTLKCNGKFMATDIKLDYL